MDTNTKQRLRPMCLIYNTKAAIEENPLRQEQSAIFHKKDFGNESTWFQSTVLPIENS